MQARAILGLAQNNLPGRIYCERFTPKKRRNFGRFDATWGRILTRHPRIY
jgi:hypothetical protein